MSRLGEYLLHNELVSHQANENIAEGLSEAPGDLTVALYCECGDDECGERISMSLHEYVDSHDYRGETFIVRPQHYHARFESVSYQGKSYWIIRKKQGR